MDIKSNNALLEEEEVSRAAQRVDTKAGTGMREPQEGQQLLASAHGDERYCSAFRGSGVCLNLDFRTVSAILPAHLLQC